MNWKTLIRNVAPKIATTLGGPAGGMAVKFLAEEFLGKETASEEELAAAIESAGPEKMLELKRLDREFALKMEALGLDRARLSAEDRKDARQILRVSIWPQVVLSMVFVVGYFLIMGILVSCRDLEFEDRVFGILNTVIGVLTGAIPMILQFWFGSSMGSREKDRRLHG